MDESSRDSSCKAMRWFRHLFGLSNPEARYQLGPPDARRVMTDILLSEVQTLYVSLQETQEEVRRSRTSLESGGADYSWLSGKRKQTRLPDGLRMELEQLCYELKPEECNNAIAYFRARARKCQSSHEVILMFQTTLKEIIHSRPPTGSLWTSLTSGGGGGGPRGRHNRICSSFSLAFRQDTFEEDPKRINVPSFPPLPVAEESLSRPTTATAISIYDEV